MPGSGSAIAITISTARGPVRGQWRPSNVTCAAAILLPDAGRPFDLFERLAPRIQRAGASVLQFDCCRDDSDEQLPTLLAALSALSRQGVERMALIGWHSGASLAIAAGGACEAVTGVAALAPDEAAVDAASELGSKRLLVLHGSADAVAPVTVSRMVFARATDPKELVIFPGERHDFSLYSDEVIDKLTGWTRCLLRSPFKARVSRQVIASSTSSPHLQLSGHH